MAYQEDYGGDGGEQRQSSTAKSGHAATGEKSLTTRLPMYDRGLLKNATSYLFTNFPENWSPKRLWYLFATYGAGQGRIVDVFIPKRKDRKGNSFGFVRFSEVKNKARLEKSLRMICFGTEKIRVALATDRKPSHPNPKPPRILPPPPPPATFKMRSFAEVLLNSPPPQKNFNQNSPQPQPTGSTEEKRAEKVTLVLDEELEDCSWLQNCATGEVHTPDLIPGLQQVLWENGFSFIRITPMGGCKILLSTDDMNLTTRFIEEEGAWWSKWFKRIKP
ncbi:hypothetical protein SLEP1_g60518, partial [Rubroshorea leprosula]